MSHQCNNKNNSTQFLPLVIDIRNSCKYDVPRKNRRIKWVGWNDNTPHKSTNVKQTNEKKIRKKQKTTHQNLNEKRSAA